MSKPLTQGQEIAALKSMVGSVMRKRNALRAENAQLTATIEAATGECIVDLPAPDSDNARLLLANKAMVRENERLTAALILLKQYAEPTPGGYIINAAPISIIDNALGDES